jgi:nucleoside-diphosphate-sugar epimerase
VTEQPRGVRGRRSDGLVVAVTGALGPLGAPVVARLADSARVRQVVALDTARGGAHRHRVTWRIADPRDPALASRLRGCDAVAHLAVDHAVGSPPVERRALNVTGTRVVLDAAATAGVRRVVLVTSAMVYGARPDNPVPIPDGAPVRADRDESVLGDLIDIERMARSVDSGMAVTVLRPAALVAPGVDSVVTRHFEAPRLLVLKGSMPTWQFCSMDDLAAAVELAVTGEVTGAVNVACAGALTQEEVERISGLRRVELPPAMARATADRLHRAGVTPATPAELDYLVHPWVVATDALAAAGWAPTTTNEAALRDLLSEARRHLALGTRRLDRTDAARAATGATVAAIGTAALLRRARRRRRG